ncbi:MAG: SDR family NAD(P)-dependent oxidoreductase [Deltaproteobacteria bacterium]|nr:SDR family NAD(P)-dependent oxidoreductase [Deltaproteobacteria bacterium]
MAAIDPGFRSKYGPWAVVAGASVGLGAAFARQLAEKGLNVVLVARRVGPLEERAKALTNAYDVEVRAVPLDLGAADMLTTLREHTRDLDVGLLVYNAALSLIGPFLEQEIAQKLEIIDINCRGPVVLADEFGRSMAARGRGGIILMSSLAGQQGSALIATYAASKAFDLVLGEGLWYELREHGVDVLSFCAGATRTPNYEASQPRRKGGFPPVMEPELVATEALAALGQGPSAVAGWGNRVASFLMRRLLPRRFAVETISRQTRAMYAK